jgi:lipoprotein signal peptidase
MDKERLVHLFHIIIVGGLFLYVAIKRTNIPKFMYKFLLILGVVIILYHGYKMYLHVIKKEPIWVSLIHILLVGPILVYIGIHKENTQWYVFEMLMMLGYAAIGYHAYYLMV